jgi:hypothetical protein
MVEDEQDPEKVCWYAERLEANPQGGGGLKDWSCWPRHWKEEDQNPRASPGIRVEEVVLIYFA